MLLVFGAPDQLRLLAWQETGRTIRLADPAAPWRALSLLSMIGLGSSHGGLYEAKRHSGR